MIAYFRKAANEAIGFAEFLILFPLLLVCAMLGFLWGLIVAVWYNYSEWIHTEPRVCLCGHPAIKALGWHYCSRRCMIYGEDEDSQD